MNNVKKNYFVGLLLLFYFFSQAQNIECSEMDNVIEIISSSECGAEMDISIAGKGDDDCSGNVLKWNIYLDLVNDGTFDFEYSSFLPEDDTLLTDDTNSNGIIDRYIAPTMDNDKVYIPAIYIPGPFSNHRVLYKLYDACDNVTTCEKKIQVVDKSPPIVIAKDNEIKLVFSYESTYAAKDFDNGSYDNCATQNTLLYTFNGEMPVITKLNTEHYFQGHGLNASEAAYNNGKAQKWVPSLHSSIIHPDCDNSYCTNKYKLTVFDERLNFDTRDLSIYFKPENSWCEIHSQIFVKTTNGENIDSIESEIIETNDTTKWDNLPQFPIVCDTTYFSIIKHEVDVTRGIDINDLIVLQAHLLGLQPLTSLYQLSAADLNEDGIINYKDLVLLYKMIKLEYKPQNLWNFYAEIGLQEKGIIDGVSHFCTTNNEKRVIIGVKKGDIDGSWK